MKKRRQHGDFEISERNSRLLDEFVAKIDGAYVKHNALNAKERAALQSKSKMHQHGHKPCDHHK